MPAHRKTILFKKAFHQGLVGDVAFYELPGRIGVLPGHLIDLGKAVFLDGYIRVIVHIVHAHHVNGGHGRKKLGDEIGADKAGGARHEDRFVL